MYLVALGLKLWSSRQSRVLFIVSLQKPGMPWENLSGKTDLGFYPPV